MAKRVTAKCDGRVGEALQQALLGDDRPAPSERTPAELRSPNDRINFKRGLASEVRRSARPTADDEDAAQGDRSQIPSHSVNWARARDTRLFTVPIAQLQT